MGQGSSGTAQGDDRDGTAVDGAPDGANFDNMDRRFCIRDRNARDAQMSRIDPESDGLLRRIDQQLGSLA